MSKSGDKLYWATLMPVFCSQAKNPNEIAYDILDKTSGLLFYTKSNKDIKFSSSILDTIGAQAPEDIELSSSLLVGTTWDGPDFFKAYILDAVCGYTVGAGDEYFSSLPQISKKSGKNYLKFTPEEMQNHFLLNSGLYIIDPVRRWRFSTLPIIPNPDFELANAILDFEYGSDIEEAMRNTSKEFYELLFPDTYGFSTTLIFPNQAEVDDDQGELKKIKELAYAKFIEELDGDDLEGLIKTLWPTENIDPYTGKKETSPWGDNPYKRDPYDSSAASAASATYEDYKKYMKKYKDDRWDPGAYNK